MTAMVYRQVRTAIATGALTRPTVCQQCGSSPRATSDGRANIQAHHHRGYDRPLDVMWLCAKCHRAHTPLPIKPGAPCLGKRNGRARLTEVQVLAIRSSTEPNAALAARYNVANATIYDIRRGKIWSWLAERSKP